MKDINGQEIEFNVFVNFCKKMTGGYCALLNIDMTDDCIKFVTVGNNEAGQTVETDWTFQSYSNGLGCSVTARNRENGTVSSVGEIFENYLANMEKSSNSNDFSM